jgi:hypothetical protein
LYLLPLDELDIASSLPPFRFPPTFFTEDCRRLSDLAKGSLFKFLAKLCRNPHSPLFEKVQEYYAFEFYPGCVVFWKLKIKPETITTIEIAAENVLRIDILEIKYFPNDIK